MGHRPQIRRADADVDHHFLPVQSRTQIQECPRRRTAREPGVAKLCLAREPERMHAVGRVKGSLRRAAPALDPANRTRCGQPAKPPPHQRIDADLHQRQHCWPCGAPRSAGLGDSARSARSTSNSARPFKRRERSERSAFRAASPRPSIAGDPGQRPGRGSGPVFFAYFLAHKQESRSAAGATSRRGLTQCDQPLNRAQAGLALHQANRSHQLDAKSGPSEHIIGPPS